MQECLEMCTHNPHIFISGPQQVANMSAFSRITLKQNTIMTISVVEFFVIAQ